ncbi:c-type heme family protein [Rhodospirillaceae bacterium SYSU D60014]|uniref:Tll0287-like domain-containing protein n=1 Tax=Virgifigura deserti TaxID=2268457 RepID=UPI000E66F68C
MGLRAKFNLVMIVAFMIGLALAGVLSYRIVQENARHEVIQKARIMMESAHAIRNYTAQEIKPLIAAQLETRFLPHSVPSFAAQTNFRALQGEFPNYVYKEAALNPTNPADRASDWEADIINEFRNNPQRKELIIERATATGRALVLSRPLQIKDDACLACHSTAAAAPSTMIELYGEANGFGWQMNEIIGAQVVSVPMSVPLEKADKTFMVFMAVLTAVFAVVMIILNVLLHYVVIKPVVKISEMASAVSMGNMSVEEYERRGKDEIASLSASFNRMRRSLENAMQMLSD